MARQGTNPAIRTRVLPRPRSFVSYRGSPRRASQGRVARARPLPRRSVLPFVDARGGAASPTCQASRGRRATPPARTPTSLSGSLRQARRGRKRRAPRDGGGSPRGGGVLSARHVGGLSARYRGSSRRDSAGSGAVLGAATAV